MGNNFQIKSAKTVNNNLKGTVLLYFNNFYPQKSFLLSQFVLNHIAWHFLRFLHQLMVYVWFEVLLKHSALSLKKDLYRREGTRCCLRDRIASIPCGASYFGPGQFEEYADLHQDELKNRVQISLLLKIRPTVK